MEIRQGGVIEGRWHGPVSERWNGRVAVVLDGTVHATVPLVPGPRGSMRFTSALPRHLVFGELDVLALPTGESLLGRPHALDDDFAIVMASAVLDGMEIGGSFTGAAWLDPEMGIEWLDGPNVAARAVATRRDGAEPAWHYRMHLAQLRRPGETVTLQPRVGGHVLPGPLLVVGAEGLGFLGCLDAATPHRVEGWAIDLANPCRRVRLDVVVNAQVVTSTTADQPREDLRKLGLGDGQCGFETSLPEHGDAAAARRIGVRLAGRLTELAGSPLTLAPVPGLIGNFDTLHGMSAHGWALDRERPDQPIRIEVVGPDGSILAAGLANQFRGDLLNAELNGGVCAFKIDLSAHFDRLMDREIIVRVAGTNQILPGSPRRVAINQNIRRFNNRKSQLGDGVLPRLKRALNYRATRGGAEPDAGITFIMPVFDTPRQWLVEALESVRNQFCDRWELVCVDDASTAPHVATVLASYAAADKRVRVLKSPENVGIARAINFGLRVARYPHVAFIDHDDTVEPDAAWQLLRAARETGADLLYSDEAQTDDNINAITELRLRPAFSHDYYLSHPYFVHIVCVRTDLARRIGGWDESMAISADVDFVLRAIEHAKVVTHVPAVLYRWRTHAASTGHSKQDSVMQATTAAIQRHLDRLGTGATVRDGVWFNQFRIDWPKPEGLILVVIPTKNKVDLLRTAIESIERTSAGTRYRIVVIDHQSDDPATCAYLERIARRHVVMPYEGPFNFSLMNNLAVAKHGGDAEFVLFLNNDIEATQDGWLERLASLAARQDVGAVGPLLMYADRHVQHAGVILGFNDSAEHALKFQPVFLDEHGRRNLGYNCALSSTRDYSAVTAACLMMRRSVFDEIGGFDEKFGIGFNDTDLCLRILAAGYRNLYDGSTILYHYESATRSQTQQVFHPEDTLLMIRRWADYLEAGDPFYNPTLSLRTQDHVPREETGCHIMNTPRATTLDLARIAAHKHERAA